MQAAPQLGQVNELVAHSIVGPRPLFQAREVTPANLSEKIYRGHPRQLEGIALQPSRDIYRSSLKHVVGEPSVDSGIDVAHGGFHIRTLGELHVVEEPSQKYGHDDCDHCGGQRHFQPCQWTAPVHQRGTAWLAVISSASRY